MEKMIMSNVPAKMSGSMFSGLNNLDTKPAETALAPIENTASGSSFVGFFVAKGKRVADIVGAMPGIQEGSPYYYDPENGYTKIDNLRYMVVADSNNNPFAFQAWIERDSENKPVAGTLQRQDFKSKMKESLDALALVFIGDKVVPTNISFGGGKSPAFHKMIEAVSQSAKPEWAEKSPDHKASLAAPFPYRVIGHVTTWMKTVGSGFKMVAAKVNPKPITAGEATILAASLNDPKFQAGFDAAKRRFLFNVESLNKVIAGTKTAK